MPTTDAPLAELYLDLMQQCVTNTFYAMPEYTEVRPLGVLRSAIAAAMNRRGIKLMREDKLAFEQRRRGKATHPHAQTMIGIARLENIRQCVKSVLDDGIAGDLIEAGVWRGGAAVFMRAILKAYGIEDRKVWLADSFRGLPEPNPEKYPHDRGDAHYQNEWLAASLDDVKATFRAYGLLDAQVAFLEGWFRDTLPGAPIQRLALMRLDGDMYESTMDGLAALYPKLSLGGYVIVDDWGVLPNCRRAVNDFRAANGVVEPIREVDGTAVYWRRER